MLRASVRLSSGSPRGPASVALALPASPCPLPNTPTEPARRGLEAGLAAGLDVHEKVPVVPVRGPAEPGAVAPPSASPLRYLQIHNSSSDLLGKHQPSPVAASGVECSSLGRGFSTFLGAEVDIPPLPSLWGLGQEHGGSCGGSSGFGERAALWFRISPAPTIRAALTSCDIK